MKKLTLVFAGLFILVLISGCNTRENTVRFDDTNVTSGETDENETNEDETDEDETDESSEDSLESEVNEEADEVEVEAVSETKNTSAAKITGDKLSVTSFDSGFLKTTKNQVTVLGSTTSNTHSIKVNAYTLQKYIPGQTEWSFLASTQYSTLKNGLNTYVVKTFDKKGKQLENLIFTIDYTAPVIPELPDVGTSHWLLLLVSLSASLSYFTLRKFKWL